MEKLTAGDIQAWLNLPYTQRAVLPKVKAALAKLETELFAKKFANIEEVRVAQELRRICQIFYSDPIKALDEIIEREKRETETTEERKF